jgi:hypothetical protein
VVVSQRPVQQSPAFLQADPAAWHLQRPETQFMVPQHSLLARHAAPLLEQHCARPVLTTVLQTSTPQHSVLLVQVASPLGLQPMGDWHVPPVHERPAQQSAVLVQLWVLPRQVHARVAVPSHRVEPQHWVLVVQVVPTPWQQVRVLGEASQRRPAQHSVASVQPMASPAMRQVVMGRRQVPLWQVVPVQHSVESTQDEPSAWHKQRPAVVSQRM